MIWTLNDMILATGGTVVHDNAPAMPIHGIEFDSRNVNDGDLFLAFKGAHSDGHDHINAAAKQGAVAALVDHEVESDLTQIIVPDVHKALWELAQKARIRTSAKIVAITGSVGKTGTRDLMTTCLDSLGKTHATAGNYNNQIGAPLSLARMPQDTDYGIFELGMDHAGEIASLSPLVAPDIAVITKIAESHIGYFDNLDGIAHAKAEIFDGLKQGGLAILNADDNYTPMLAEIAKEKGAGRIMRVGTYGNADVRIEQIEKETNGYQVSIRIDGAVFTFTLGMSAIHWIWSAVMGLAAVAHFGGDLDAAATKLAQHRELDGRGARHNLIIDGKSVTLIDDSYNASPASMAAGIANLGATKASGDGRKIAILADMLELGDEAGQYHRDLAEHIIKGEIDILICFGPMMAELADDLCKPTKDVETHHCDDADAAIALTLSLISDHDVILVKGSNGMKAHLVAKTLKSKSQALASQANGDPHAA